KSTTSTQKTTPETKAAPKFKSPAEIKKSLRERRKMRSSRYGAKYFPNIELTNQDGKKFKLFDDLLKDKVVSINFIFTSCENVCPLETARLKEVYEIVKPRLGKDLFMYSITVDPARDTPEKLKAYKKKFGIGDDWDFLTGNKKDIDELRTKLGLYIKDLNETLPNGQIDHNISLVMGNTRTGKWMKRSPYEDAAVLATMFGDWLTNWRNKPVIKSVDYKTADNLATTYSDGEFLFRTRCRTCHTIGGGDGVGPDLKGIMKKREKKWLARWIKEPNVMIREKDPIALALYEKFNRINMPNLRMSNADVTNLFEYFESQDNPKPKVKKRAGIK
ncbi:Cytochrome oxidase biogenesis protein Sco1/SenC/PrrC, thiol-disulfide reductase involved in Cu(I) insertion into CoxII Cu(A) center, partial [hydrothermal vent metagenome]